MPTPFGIKKMKICGLDTGCRPFTVVDLRGFLVYMNCEGFKIVLSIVASVNLFDDLVDEFAEMTGVFDFRLDFASNMSLIHSYIELAQDHYFS